MRAQEFVGRHRTEWQRLEQLLRRSRRAGGLRPGEALEMTALYRRSAADLARAQRDWPDEPVVHYLNGLVAQGHAAVYRDRSPVLGRLARFYATTVPQTYRASAPFLVASALLLFGPAAVAFGALLAQPGLADRFVSPALLDMVKHHRLWTSIPTDARPLASGLIMTNNIWVSVLAFVLGIFFAVPTIAVLLLNGVNLGALLGLTTAYGVGGGLLEFVIGHGVLELSVVVAAGASGLMLGWSLLQPGTTAGATPWPWPAAAPTCCSWGWRPCSSSPASSRATSAPRPPRSPSRPRSAWAPARCSTPGCCWAAGATPLSLAACAHRPVEAVGKGFARACESIFPRSPTWRPDPKG